MYSKKALEHFKNPKFTGKIRNPDAVGESGNIQCGDIMKIYLKIENNKIKKVRFQTYGCIAAIASTDVVCKLAQGKTLKKALNITPKDVMKELGPVPPIKTHCALLGISTLKKAIADYRKKYKSKQKSKKTNKKIKEKTRKKQE